MTEYWKSNAMHWCDVCRCWMNDNKQTIALHERGMGHKDNLAKKIRDMSKKAEQEKNEKEKKETAMKRIENEARKRFEADQKEAEAATGVWTWDESAAYYYNEKQGWYYDPKTSWYYGGSPPEWSQAPSIPDAAKFGNARHEGGPVGQRGTASKPVSAAAAAAAAASTSSAPIDTKVVKKVIELPKHPLLDAGGYQMPLTGKVGAAKGIGLIDGKSTAAVASKPAQAGDPKRKRDDKPLTAEEAAFLARREAARQRVQQRSAQQFGFA